MKLSQLIQDLNVSVKHEFDDREILGISHKSQNVKNDFLFVAIKGHQLDGHNFVNDALCRGAVAIVTEQQITIDFDVPQFVVHNGREALSYLSSLFYGQPSNKLKVIGVTGTNGKTTTTYLIRSIIEYWLRKNNLVNYSVQNNAVGLIGTIEYAVGDDAVPARETTPESIEVQKMIGLMVEQKVGFAIMETSSQALVQHRVDNIDFKVAVFTNLTPEHLDYHSTFEKYREAKSILFSKLSSNSYAILNADDKSSSYLSKITKANIIWYGINNNADITCKIVKILPDSTDIVVSVKGIKSVMQLPFIGLHNVYNALASIATGISLGLDIDVIKEGLCRFKGVPGRLESVACSLGFKVFVDYAHTADALESVLQALNQTRLKGGRILLVFGCGGDRDKEKRSEMGQIAGKYADIFWITNDNPRSESPDKIILDIKKGVKSKSLYFVQPDRELAVRDAINEAKLYDVVLIAGKGHETKQIVGKEIIEFDDRKVAKDLLRMLAIKKTEIVYNKQYVVCAS